MSQGLRRWSSLLAEAVLIVASILLAFAIDAWWDGQQEDRRRAELLAALHDDFTATSEDLQVAIAKGDELTRRSGGFLHAVREGQDLSRDSLTYLFGGISDVAFFEPTLASYQTAMASGTIELVRSQELVAALSDFDFAERLFRLHLDVSADLYYLGPIQELRRTGVGFDDPESRRIDRGVSVPADFDLRGEMATASAEPLYTVQWNMLANLQEMQAAASRAISELELLLDG